MTFDDVELVMGDVPALGRTRATSLPASGSHRRTWPSCAPRVVG
ncbi:hypothetical protein [Janibacter melonis]|nr:hypothetical protein [Janibacter melonis]